MVEGDDYLVVVWCVVVVGFLVVVYVDGMFGVEQVVYVFEMLVGVGQCLVVVDCCGQVECCFWWLVVLVVVGYVIEVQVGDIVVWVDVQVQVGLGMFVVYWVVVMVIVLQFYCCQYFVLGCVVVWVVFGVEVVIQGSCWWMVVGEEVGVDVDVFQYVWYI